MHIAKSALAALVIVTAIAGCAAPDHQTEKRVVKGGAVGAAVGAVRGIFTGDVIGGALVGGAAGAAGGAVIDQIEKADQD